MAESKKNSDDKTKPIVDVAKPGKTAPSGNSKSVIVTNRPILKDPMVVPEDDSVKTDSEPKKMGQGSVAAKADVDKTGEELPEGKTIAQLAEEASSRAKAKTEPEPEEAEEKAEVKDETKTDSKPARATGEKVLTPLQAKEEKEEKADKDLPTDKKPALTADETDKADETAEPGKAGDTDTDDKPAKKGSKTEEAPDAKTKKHEAMVQELVENKQYFLPINSVEKRRSKRFVILGILLSVVLALAWVNIALDAGLIEINGLKPVTHFFSS